ncbi:hypothetical protein A3J78_00085 [Candidatus Beckwithbacteria bacterium RBG_13_35_6]|uniref:DUF4342 domain-containing protein n=1 Tax=Candidatus Beckwithbacteria bacterium RBG_13_35_6 TaxID=1797456 RepID=A0A1F5DGZ1_9BACT|nr:MAG: hypothetical protein A3J78_00085 [Candidatus Beckwithbacteria bacterium RBG_13_35_6]
MPTKSTKKTSKKSAAAKTTETFKVHGVELLKKIKDLINEGNVRRITIKDKNGKNLIVLPLTIGVVGAVIAPMLAAVGAVAALVTECTVSVERDKTSKK